MVRAARRQYVATWQLFFTAARFKITPLPPVGNPQQSKEPVRGIWLATVSRLDWPPISSVNISSPAVRISQQQKALTDKLDNLKRLGINTVFSV